MIGAGGGGGGGGGGGVEVADDDDAAPVSDTATGAAAAGASPASGASTVGGVSTVVEAPATAGWGAGAIACSSPVAAAVLESVRAAVVSAGALDVESTATAEVSVGGEVSSCAKATTMKARELMIIPATILFSIGVVSTI